MSQAKGKSDRPGWIGWAVFSSKYIQIIHDSKFDFLEINIGGDNSQ
jgi:hypothetical protein